MCDVLITDHIRADSVQQKS